MPDNPDAFVFSKPKGEVFAHQVQLVRGFMADASVAMHEVDPFNLSLDQRVALKSYIHKLGSFSPEVVRAALGTYSDIEFSRTNDGGKAAAPKNPFWSHNPGAKEQTLIDYTLGYLPSLRIDNQTISNGRMNYYGKEVQIVGIDKRTPSEDLVVSEVNIGLLSVRNKQGNIIGFIDLHPHTISEWTQIVQTNIHPVKEFFSHNLVGGSIQNESDKDIYDFLNHHDRINRILKPLFSHENLATLPLEGKYYLAKMIIHAKHESNLMRDIIQIMGDFEIGREMLYFIQSVEGDPKKCQNFINVCKKNRFMLQMDEKGEMIHVASTARTNLTAQEVLQKMNPAILDRLVPGQKMIVLHPDIQDGLLKQIGGIEMFLAEATAAQHGNPREIGRDNFERLLQLTKTQARKLTQSVCEGFFQDGHILSNSEWQYIANTYKRFFQTIDITYRRRTKRSKAVKQEIPFDLLQKAFDYLATIRTTQPMYDIQVMWFIAQALENQEGLSVEEKNRWTQQFYHDIAPIIYNPNEAAHFVNTPVEVKRLLNARRALVQGSSPTVEASLGIGKGRVEIEYVKKVRENHQNTSPIGTFYGFDMMADLKTFFDDKSLNITFEQAEATTFWKKHKGELDLLFLNWSPLNNQELMMSHLIYAAAMNKSLKMGGKLLTDLAAIIPAQEPENSFWTIMEEFHNRYPLTVPGAKWRKDEYKMGNESADEIGMFGYFHEWYLPMMKAFGFKVLNIPDDPTEFKKMIQHYTATDTATLVRETNDEPDAMKRPFWAAPSLRFTPIFEKVGEIEPEQINKLINEGRMPPFLAHALLQSTELFQKADQIPV